MQGTEIKAITYSAMTVLLGGWRGRGRGDGAAATAATAAEAGSAGAAGAVAPPALTFRAGDGQHSDSHGELPSTGDGGAPPVVLASSVAKDADGDEEEEEEEERRGARKAPVDLYVIVDI